MRYKICSNVRVIVDKLCKLDREPKKSRRDNGDEIDGFYTFENKQHKIFFLLVTVRNKFRWMNSMDELCFERNMFDLEYQIEVTCSKNVSFFKISRKMRVLNLIYKKKLFQNWTQYYPRTLKNYQRNPWKHVLFVDRLQYRYVWLCISGEVKFVRVCVSEVHNVLNQDYSTTDVVAFLAENSENLIFVANKFRPHIHTSTLTLCPHFFDHIQKNLNANTNTAKLRQTHIW